MNANKHTDLILKIKNDQSILGIILALGWVLLVVSILNEGFSGDMLAWIFAVIDGSLYWFILRQFINNPGQSILKSLKTIFKTFVLVWIVAVATTLIMWGELYIETVFGIILFLVGTFFMNRINSNGKMHLDS